MLVTLALIPGLPKFSFLAVAAVLFVAAYLNREPEVSEVEEKPARLHRRRMRSRGP